MAYILTADERAHFEEQLAAAQPYDDDDPEWNMFDGEVDEARASATLAKQGLAEDDRRRKKLKQP